MSVERQLMMSSGGVQQQYTISNSLRFRASASAYLSRTPASAGNRQTWTWSGWVKRGTLASEQYLMNVRNGISDNNTLFFYFTSSDALALQTNSTPNPNVITTQVFRDPSAWYHIVLSVDTTQATASNRIKIYVNGAQVTSFSSSVYPAQNANLGFNQAFQHQIGCFYNGTSYSLFFDGYLTEINFIDGQALTPSSFGETSSTTGVWIPKKYTGSYGTNGFYLNFNNNTSTTALGYDTSGNGNNWTPNNFSLTTGSTYDSMIDSPTSYASGTNNVGNYAVLNPLYAYSSFTLSGGNLNAASTANYRSAISTIGVSSGKWYWEYVVTAVGNDTVIGITSNPTATVGTYAGGDAASWGYEALSGNKYNNGAFSAYGAAYTTNDVIGIAFDANAGSLTFYKNGVSQGVAYSGLASGTYYAAFGLGNPSTGSANFGQRPFAYTPPSGYNALNTYNLSTPSIVDGSKQFAASLYTGTGSSLSVSGANFTPDFVWIKSRSAATDHALYDVIRGTQARLESNTTDAEVTSDNGVTAFNSTGFTVGTLAQVNTSSATYVGWQWKANGTAVTNTAGSITSSVSANTTAGFSVVTYTGTGANATVGHGLGVALSMIFIKSRTGATTDPAWIVGHTGIVMGSGRLVLNSTAANSTSGAATLWNSTAATSSVFSLGNYVAVNESGSTYVAYCFAAIPGYSAFGSYTGNGSADGAFIYTGFLPKLILVKCSSSTGNWFMLDTARNTYNVIGEQLESNLSNAGSTVTTLDVLSNGFKMRTSSDPNASQTYVYAAFAASPFKNSLAF